MKILFALICCLCLFPRAASAADIFIESDATWKVTKLATLGWTDTVYNDATWLLTKAPTRGTCDYYPDPIFFALPMWAQLPKAKETAYFRKVFTVEDRIQKATLKVGFDDDGDVYINGTLVLTDNSGLTEKTPLVADVTSFLKQGTNNISLRVTDSFGGCQWAQASLRIEKVEGTFLDVPLFKQSDPQWGGIEFDHAIASGAFCGSTIRDCGCPMVSMAMLLKYHGVTRSPDGRETTPNTLNDYFKQDAQCVEGGCISRGYVFGNIRWDATNRYSKEANVIYGSPKVQFVSSQSYDPQVVKEDIIKGNPVILKSPNTSHWFVGTGFYGSTFTINDPLFSRTQLDDPSYGNTAGAIRRYEKVNSDFSLIEAYIRTPGQLLITDMYGRRAGYDAAIGETMNEIPGALYSFEQDIASDSSPEHGLMWLYVPQPEKGVYTISSYDDTKSFALYVSDQAGSEQYTLATNSARIYYDPRSTDNLMKDPQQLQACLRR